MDPIQELIVEGELGMALSKLTTTVPTHLKTEATLLQARLKELELKVIRGLLPNDEISIERNNIIIAALNLNDLSKTSTNADDTQPTNGVKSNSTSSTAKTKILFLAANPDNETRLQTDREYRLLRAQLERGSQRDAFDFLPPQFAVTITELVRAMNDKPNIVHFSGHGETNGILITSEDNKSQPIPLPALQRLFKPLRGITQIVVLNACYSAEQAQEISKLGIYVVGNNAPITDPAALDLSEGLYNGFGEGKSFEDAYNDAMIVLLTRNPDQAAVVEVWKDGGKLDL